MEKKCHWTLQTLFSCPPLELLFGFGTQEKETFRLEPINDLSNVGVFFFSHLARAVGMAETKAEFCEPRQPKILQAFPHPQYECFTFCPTVHRDFIEDTLVELFFLLKESSNPYNGEQTQYCQYQKKFRHIASFSPCAIASGFIKPYYFKYKLSTIKTHQRINKPKKRPPVGGIFFRGVCPT